MTIFAPASYPSSYPGDAVRDYPTLKQAIQDWFARSDIGGFIDYFIQVAEERIYRDIFARNQGTGVAPLETSISTTINANGVVPLSVMPGYLGMRYLAVNLDNRAFELFRKNPEYIYTYHSLRAPSSSPQYYAREGQNIIFGPFPDSEYSITGIYWQRFPPLTASNPVSWMTQTTPLMLLQACNAAVAAFLKDEEALQFWEPAYQQTLASFLLADRAEEWSGSAPSMVAG